MKRPSLKAAIDWIARHDEPTEMDPSEMEGLISVVMVADLFGVEAMSVAERVIKQRNKIARLEGYDC